jgi:hypothetical protein
MSVKIFENYSFYSKLFKYILEKYHNPTIERKAVDTFEDEEEVELDVYTIGSNPSISGVYIYGFDFSAGDWYWSGDYSDFIMYKNLKDLCFKFSKKAGYDC